jgi:hypothetical protein
MNPRGSKDGHDPSRSPRAPSTTETEHEEECEVTAERSQSEGEEETEDGHGDHSTSGSGSPSTRYQSDSGAIASLSNMATASGTFLKYRRQGGISSGQIGAPPSQASAQPSTRPHDPQTPPRNTSRGQEGDFRAGHIPRYQTQPGYHREVTDARRDHEHNREERTSAALPSARVAEESALGRRPAPRQTLARDQFGLQLIRPPHAPGSASQILPAPGGPAP